MTPDTVITFTGGNFKGSHAAEAFLRSRGFSFGALQGDAPRGILFGQQRLVSKWRGLNADHRRALHGWMTGSPHNGPVTITIFATAPDPARAAVSKAA